jgi:NADH-quinone oxidoreductase subunit C
VTSADAIARIKDAFGVEAVGGASGIDVTVDRERWHDVAVFARRDLGCVYFNWLTAVDWKEQGLEVLCRVENLPAHVAITLRTRLAVGDTHCPSVTDVWRGANWMERECYDMMGVVFDGHPDLRRILLPQDWEGFPLRKDYAVDTPHAPYR